MTLSMRRTQAGRILTQDAAALPPCGDPGGSLVRIAQNGRALRIKYQSLALKLMSRLILNCGLTPCIASI